MFFEFLQYATKISETHNHSKQIVKDENASSLASFSTLPSTPRLILDSRLLPTGLFQSWPMCCKSEYISFPTTTTYLVLFNGIS